MMYILSFAKGEESIYSLSFGCCVGILVLVVLVFLLETRKYLVVQIEQLKRSKYDVKVLQPNKS